MDAAHPQARPGLVKLDDCSLRPLGVDDFELVQPVLQSIPPVLFQGPRVDAGYRHFLGRLSKLPWSLPCACLVDGRAIGVCFMRVPQLKHLSAYLVPLFADAGAAHRPLALYMRHAFWTFPLHKLYTHVPAHESAEPYASLLRRAGFREEGTLKDHAVAGDRTIDALLFGLLRAEFDAWCAAHEPRLLLS